MKDHWDPESLTVRKNIQMMRLFNRVIQALFTTQRSLKMCRLTQHTQWHSRTKLFIDVFLFFFNHDLRLAHTSHTGNWHMGQASVYFYSNSKDIRTLETMDKLKLYFGFEAEIQHREQMAKTGMLNRPTQHLLHLSKTKVELKYWFSHYGSFSSKCFHF